MERIAYVEDKRLEGAWHVMGKKNKSLARVYREIRDEIAKAS